jgi:hypothetical protein
MKMFYGSPSSTKFPLATLFVVFLLTRFHVATAATYTARWIGAANGSWNVPSNWDLGQVPKNSGSDVYDVIWDVHAVTVSVDQAIEIHSFTWTAGGALQLQAGLNVDGDFTCATGTFLGAGELNIGGKTTHSGAQRIDLSVQVVFTQGFFQTQGLLRIEGATILAPSVLAIYQRNSISNTYDQFPAADTNTCKLVQLSWICRRPIIGSTQNTESVQSAKIVIRKQ